MGHILGIDFDDTLAAYEGPGRGELGGPIAGGRAAIEHFAARGFEPYILTARPDLREIRAWLKTHGFPPMIVTHTKLSADVYVDDRAFRFRAWDWTSIERIKQLAKE